MTSSQPHAPRRRPPSSSTTTGARRSSCSFLISSKLAMRGSESLGRVPCEPPAPCILGSRAFAAHTVPHEPCSGNCGDAERSMSERAEASSWHHPSLGDSRLELTVPSNMSSRPDPCGSPGEWGWGHRQRSSARLPKGSGNRAGAGDPRRWPYTQPGTQTGSLSLHTPLGRQSGQRPTNGMPRSSYDSRSG